MHPEAINDPTKRVFESLAKALSATWYLAGGTALAIQIGHRLSVDLDWFSAEDFSHRIMKAFLATFGQFELTGEDEGTVHGTLAGVRVSFLLYPYPLIYPSRTFMGTLIADERDIAAMKFDAISSRGSKKDFIDLYVLLEKYSFTELWSIFERKYAGIRYNKLHILKSLTYFETAEQEPMPFMLRDIPWQAVKDRITDEAQAALRTVKTE